MLITLNEVRPFLKREKLKIRPEKGKKVNKPLAALKESYLKRKTLKQLNFFFQAFREK